jgi:hypothetical protein
LGTRSIIGGVFFFIFFLAIVVKKWKQKLEIGTLKVVWNRIWLQLNELLIEIVTNKL